MLELTAIKIADYLGNDLTAISKGTTKTIRGIEMAVKKINEKKICKYLSLTPVTLPGKAKKLSGIYSLIIPYIFK